MILSLISVLFSFLEMELFKTEFLKKEYKEFVEKTIPKIVECNCCNHNCCKNHYHYEVMCLNCRTKRCKNCQIFNQQMDALMQAANEQTRKYIYNFMSDFFSLSNESLIFFYNVKKTNETDEVDITDFTWKLRMYHGVKYQVESLAKTMKFTYTIRKRRFVYLRK